jgi:hypothetical protein
MELCHVRPHDHTFSGPLADPRDRSWLYGEATQQGCGQTRPIAQRATTKQADSKRDCAKPLDAASEAID